MSANVLKFIQNTLSNLGDQDFVDGFHNSVIDISYRYNTDTFLLRLMVGDCPFFVKFAFKSSLCAKKLLDEIRWYEAINSNKDWAFISHTPRYIGSIKTDKFICLVLEYLIDINKVSNLLLKSKMSLTNASKILEESINLLDIHPGKYTKTEEILLHKNVICRLNNRTKILESLDRRENNSIFKYWSSVVSVNGYPPISLAMITQWLIEQSGQIIRPDLGLLGKTHGDLHLENILINKQGLILLVDPNAIIGSIPIYDLGKLSHSIFGLYDLVHTANFKLDIYKLCEINIEFPEDILKNYMDLENLFDLLIFSILGGNSKIQSVYCQIKLMCLCHFICLLPHHFQNRQIFLGLYARTIALYYEIRTII